MENPWISFLSVLLLSLSFSTICSYASHSHGDETHTLQVSSLLPSSVCTSSSSSQGNKGTNNAELRSGSVLKVVHKHGPCSQMVNEEKVRSQSHGDILESDESRVQSIHAKLSKTAVDPLRQTKSTSIAAKSGSTLGFGNYIVSVGLGSPKKQLSLVFDTGSDLTWTQCQPCLGSCYSQKEPIFDPSLSSSYSNISCSAPSCSALSSSTGSPGQCSGPSCVYGIHYGDQSFSEGFLGTETLSLTSTDVFPNFLFGCGQNNQGLFRGVAGLLGLGRDKLSLVGQTAAKYGQVFSYCLPSTNSGTGHLTFGKTSTSAKFTRLSKISAGSSFYGLDFVSISVGGKALPIASSVFMTSGAIIDSGTVITRLPPAAYAELRKEFRQQMAKYPMAPALRSLDTCYDLSAYETVSVPKIAFTFSGGVRVDIDVSGTFYVVSAKQMCLGFIANQDPTDVAIYGNTQQLTLEVVYDAVGGRVGFAPAGCA